MAILESLPDEPIKRTMLLQVVRIGDVTDGGLRMS